MILFIISGTPGSATDYYLSSSGNDLLNDGLSSAKPWKTISKINSVFLKPGDRILFRRGDIFYGTLKINMSGISGSPITYGAYGSGQDPLITGFTALTSWKDEGKGIFSTSLKGIFRLEMVLMDNKQCWMGRFPKTGYLSYDSFYSDLSITDNNLPPDPDWTGAEIFFRKTFWSTNRATIINHINHTLKYSEIIRGNNEKPTRNFGYFIQNDIRTLSKRGDWFYDRKSSKLFIFFGSEKPEQHNVRTANLGNLINISGQNFITIENLHLSGCNQRAIDAKGVKSLTINNCLVDYAGSQGIYLVWESTSSDIVIHNCGFRKINGNAVELFANRISFTDNTIDSIGLIPGACYGSNDGNGLYGQFDNGLIQFNEISNTGHNGIYPSGSDFLIANNYIHNTVMEYLDAGAIYITHDRASYPGQILRNNIIINSMGNNWGTDNFKSIWCGAEGIYLDSYNDNVTVEGNTVSECNQGLKLFESQGTVVKNNTIFNNAVQVAISNSDASKPLHPVRGLKISGNTAVSKTAGQITLFFFSVENDIDQFGTSDSNCWARPVKDDKSFYINVPLLGAKYMNLERWQSLTGQDAGSSRSPLSINDPGKIEFYYNPSATDKIITLISPMTDVKGRKYKGTVTILPYCSLILIPGQD